MVLKEFLQARLNELLTAVEQSAANHNALVGRLHECKHQLEKIAENALTDASETAVNDLLDQVLPDNKVADEPQ